MYRSTNSGLNWTFITTDTAPYVTDLEVSPGYPADPTVFISIYNDGIFRSDNGGLSWTHLPAPQFSPDFRITLSPDFNTDNTLFVGANGISDGEAFRSNDRGDALDANQGWRLYTFGCRLAELCRRSDCDRSAAAVTGRLTFLKMQAIPGIRWLVCLDWALMGRSTTWC